MNLRLTKDIFIETAAILFIVLFVYAGVNKLADMDEFILQLSKSPLLIDIRVLTAWVVPITELCVAMLLVFSATQRLGLNLSLWLMALFTFYIISILNFSEYIPCSCGGVLGKLGWREHLVFNIAFTLLAVLALWLADSNKIHSTLRSAAICTSALVLVGGLFLTHYDDQNKYSTFDRILPDSDLKAQSRLDLKFNSYYFAGHLKDSIYLGNETALVVLSLDTALHSSAMHRIQMPDRGTADALKILNGNFFMTDGQRPFVLTGKVGQWVAGRKSLLADNISRLVPISSGSFFVRTYDRNTREYQIERQSFDRPAQRAQNLLQKQVDGLFCVDGMLWASPELNMLVYIYYYRNQFIVTDTLLHVAYRGQTLDTVTRAKIEVADVGTKYHSISATPLFVNKLSCVDSKLLFIGSGIRARNQSVEQFDRFMTFDAYDLIDHRYKFSFTVESLHGKTRSIMAYRGYFYMLAGNFITRYDLNDVPKYRDLKDILQGQ